MKSKIILGTVQFGLNYGINNPKGKPAPEQVFEILEYAASKGVEILDTADAYGNASELLGNFNKSNPALFKINTKFKFSKEPLKAQLSMSLDKLCLDSIETYFYHNFNDFIKHPELLDQLLVLKQEGLINKIGISVYDNEELRIAILTKEIDAIQFPFNLLDNRYQRGELMKFAKSKGKELQVRSVFLQGLFFKSIESIPSKLDLFKSELQKIHDMAGECGLAIEMIALLYVLNQNEIDNVIIGVDNLEQLKTNFNFMQQKLMPEIIERIDQIAVKETELLYPKNWN
jgi:aryl-alcohol dehydrogenase-like predicted oxidoreductase